MTAIRIFWILLLFTTLSLNVFAIDNNSTQIKRPKIGLVLSGGGAKGVAHIGVLKVLEEQQIPIDMVVGTSMGAIVGGLYAAGLSIEELEAVVTNIDWAEAFNDQDNRNYRSVRNKADDVELLSEVEIGYRDGMLRLPKGVFQGQKITAIIRNLTTVVAKVNHFDEFPISFRAVATDLATGNPVVFEQGDLTTALRASMSVPGVFEPVQYGDKLLIDGGVANNIPVDIAKAMGADRLIVVDLGSPLKKPEELNSPLGVSQQVLNILMDKVNNYQLSLLSELDILIAPELNDFSGADFFQIKEIIPIGEETTRKILTNKEHSFSVDNIAYETFKSRVRYTQEKSNIDAAVISFMHINNDSTIHNKIIENQIRQKTGTLFNQTEFEMDIAYLYGMNYFASIDYQLIQKNHKTGIEITIKGKPWGPTIMNFGLELSDDFSGDSFYTLSTLINYQAINKLGAEWRNYLWVGEKTGFWSEFYQPINYNSNFFITPSLSYISRDLPISVDANRLFTLRTKQSKFRAHIGYELSRATEVVAGYELMHTNADVKVGDPNAIGDLNTTDGNFYAWLLHDSLDDISFPKSGQLIGVKWTGASKSINTEEQNDAIFFNGLWPIQINQKNTLVMGLEASTLLDGDASFANTQFLGDLTRLSGLPKNEVFGPYSILSRLIYYHQLGDFETPNSIVPVYLGGSIEAGNAWINEDDVDFNDLIYAGSVFIAFNTIIGPIHFAYGRNDLGFDRFYFGFGSIYGDDPIRIRE